ncbi:hypothetical protein niasHT_001386 [Heterodera trifolii]|uniref:Uncharacterized protein n=1 Tax=Heterodera trifolii TaxID=157864 RepID=A0ABD2LNE2_9BILA
MQLFIEQRLFQIELYLDFVARTESATDEAAKMEHRQKMVALKTAKEKVFADEAGVIVMDIRRENQANLIATAMELLIMHNEIIKGLIENEQNFLDKVKNNAKAEKQHGNENKNNGKEDEEEKREGAEKGDEKGREKEDETIGEEGETEKEDKKGREKMEQKVGSEGDEKEKGDEKGREEEDEKEGEQLEQKGGSEGDEKEKEDKKGGEVDEKGGCEEDEKEKGDKKGGEKEDENGIEKEDESIGEKAKKENEDKKEREKVEQKGGSEEDEKEKENKKEKGTEEDEKGRDEMEKGDKKGKEKVEQKGGSEEEEKEKEHKKEKEKVEQKGGGDEKGGDRGGAENKRCVDSDAESDLISCYQHLMCADQPISKIQFEKDDEMGRLYLALFASADSAAKVFQAEINLGIKMLESQINKHEQLVRNYLNYSEIMIARAKLRATAAVQLHFRHDEKFRIICGQIAYVSYLSQKMDDPFTLWNSPTKCFSISREDTLSSLRVAHRECHWDFVMNRLTDPEENSFLSTVRQKRGTLALLEKLIGGPLLNMLWKTNEAPAKFKDENCKLTKKKN